MHVTLDFLSNIVTLYSDVYMWALAQSADVQYDDSNFANRCYLRI